MKKPNRKHIEIPLQTWEKLNFLSEKYKMFKTKIIFESLSYFESAMESKDKNVMTLKKEIRLLIEFFSDIANKLNNNFADLKNNNQELKQYIVEIIKNVKK